MPDPRKLPRSALLLITKFAPAEMLRTHTRVLIYATSASLVLIAIADRPVRAAITVSGNTSPVYNNADPWAPISLIVGDTAPGSMTIDAGSLVNNSGSATVANSSAASTSAVSVTGAGSKWKSFGSLRLGFRGAGTLDIAGGGSVESGGGEIGSQPGSNGTVTVGGGIGTSTWTDFSSLTVGFQGPGTLNIVGGGSVSSRGAYIGNWPGISGSVTVGGGTGSSAWTNSSALTVGYRSSGSLNIIGGGSVSNTFGFIGSGSGSSGAVTVGGGTGTSTWTNANDLRVGYNGTGTLDIAGGGSVSNTAGYIGFSPGSSGAVSIGGGMGTSNWTNSGYQYVGYRGTGTLDITGGGNVSSLGAYIGYDAGGDGDVTIGGGTGSSTWTNRFLFVGYNYSGIGSTTGTLNITGGGIVSNIDCYIGGVSGGEGTVTVGGGTGTSTWTNSGTLYVGMSGTGTLNINTGALVSAAGLSRGNATSSVNFDGGTLRITSNNTASNTINLLSGGGTIDVSTAGATFAVTSPINGSGSLTKAGPGTLIFTGANVYSGGTTINDGNLLADNTSGSAIGSGAVTVNSGGVLGGNGTIVGDVTNAGVLAPGASVGTLNIDGNYTQSAAGTLQFDLASASSFDQLNVGGAAALAGALELSLLGGYTPAAGAQFDVLDFGSHTGTFSSVMLPTLESSLSWDTSQLYTNGLLSVAFAGAGATYTHGDSTVLEPTSFSIIASAILLLKCRRRRRDLTKLAELFLCNAMHRFMAVGRTILSVGVVARRTEWNVVPAVGPRLALVLVATLGAPGSLRAQMEHVVFITSTTHGIAPGSINTPTGSNFGGQGAADFLCTEQAYAAGFIPDWNGFDKVWRALISSTGANANTRMNIIGRVVNTHGDILAVDQADFWDSTIATGVNYNEFGVLLPNNSTFWTGSNGLGEVSQNALNWTATSSGQLANAGRSQSTVNWLNQVQLSASQSLRLLAISEARVINEGDFNDDGQVDAADYTTWRDTLGSSVARGFDADGDGDTLITLADYDVWRAKFGTIYSAGSGADLRSTVVPEPGALSLMGCVAIGLMVGRRRRGS